MANKQSFTPEEWTKVLQSPILVGIAVSAADPSGVWGTLKEAFASSSALASAKLDVGFNELVRAVAADFETAEARSELQKALRQCFADDPLTALTVSPTCVRCHQSSMPKRRATQPPSKVGW